MANAWSIIVLFLSFNLFPLLVTIEASNFTNAACVEIERQALVQFKQSIGDPSGRLSSWIGDDCCRWKGVSCSPHTGNVISLDLRNPYNLTYPEYIMSDTEAEAYNYSCLSGEIDPSLVELKNLQYLDLSVNNFQGIQIPDFIGSLRELKYLNLSHASFAGRIPPNLGNLSNLEYLDLFPYNYIKIYPEKLWVSDANWLSQLSSLKYLNLGNVDLSLISATWVQALNELPSLVELRLPGCDLRSIPQSILWLNLGSLRVLHLYDNHFNSSLLPQWLFNVTSLVDLNFMNSELEGLMSSYPWGNLCNLRALDSSYNEFSGEVVDLLDSFSECSNFSIEVLHMAYNQLSGEIPESIGNLWSLKSLRLFGNSLTGSIPTSFERLSLLQDLDLSANKLSGVVPESIGQLEALTYLDLSGNSWVGNFSELHFLKLKNLRVFSLSSVNSSLKFNVRQEWVPPFSLQVLLLRDCQIGPQFPAWLQTQKEIIRITLIGDGVSDPIPGWFWNFTQQIRWLEFQNNRLHGTIPERLNFSLTQRVDMSSNRLVGDFPICLNVQSLSLNDNNFSGPIPSNIGQMMSKTSILQLSGNSFSGEIPASLIEMKQLTTLDFSNNKLSGDIPSNWQGLEEVNTIDFSQNNLSGGIPSSMCLLPQLQVLKLSGNNLSGLLSRSLINCTRVSSLDLGYNQFTGDIPSWIVERLLPVEILIMRANMLTGSIPYSLCRLPDLHILDFAHNNLSGSIPPCLGNLSSLMSFKLYNPVTNRVVYSEQVDLNVKGREVEYTKILSVVNVIDLSGNNLQGQIPDDITKLSYLGTLNLSRNQLSGEIPQSIGKLKLLESLDLSSNKLSGPIPLSMPSMTALNYLNLSDNDLSGRIPSANQFQTFVDPSIYEGNSGLCGFPLANRCSTPNEGDEDDEIMEDDENDWIDMIWFYSGLAPGFMVGFWVVCGTLIVKKAWRHAYFNFVDTMKDTIYSAVSK